MKNKKKYLVFIIILFILNSRENVLCQDTLRKIGVTFTTMVGTYFPAFSTGFLTDYADVLGGSKKDFLHNFSYTLMLSGQWNENYRISAKVGYISAKLQDNFAKETYEGSNTWRTFGENIEVNTVPLLVNLDWYFYYDIYKSFLSCGLGTAYSEIFWDEFVNSPIKNDPRIGGKIMNEIKFYPAISLTSGIQLDFDKESIPHFIKGLTIAADFLYVIRSTDVFGKLREQIIPAPEQFKSNKSVLPFMIGLNIGLVFNLQNKQINRIFGNK